MGRILWAVRVSVGAGIGGLAMGTAEAIYRDVPWLYGACLYGSLWCAAGAALGLLLACLPRGPKLGAWLGLAASLSTCTFGIGFGVLYRDLLREAVHERVAALWASAGLATVVALTIWLIGRFATRTFMVDIRPRAWLLALAFLSALLPAWMLWPHAGNDAPLDQPTPLTGAGVILIVADALRADVLGTYGAASHRERAPTPRLDELASTGLVFEDCSAQASWTKPAVASILTSLNPSSHGAVGKNDVLSADLPSLATHLKAQGVHTAAVVTNYNLEGSFGFDTGFDEFSYLPPVPYLRGPPRANYLVAYDLYRIARERLLPRLRQVENFYRPAAAVNGRAFQILDRVGARPFFLWLHYMEPHDPYFDEDGTSWARVENANPAAALADRMRRAYRDNVHRLDLGIGALLDGLRARAVHNVHIVFTADHGEEFFDHGGFFHGTTLYQEQIHVPLLVSGPKITAGRTAKLARQIDIAPLIAGLLEQPTDPTWQGVDVLRGEVAHSLAEEDHQGNVLTAVREGPRKLLLANPGNPRGLPEQQLFDLVADPGEQQPLPVDAETAVHMDALRRAFQNGIAPIPVQRPLDAAASSELRALGYVQ